MSELDILYHDLILDHASNPRNVGKLVPACGSALGNNPMCGDRIKVTVQLKGELVEAIRFEGYGCAISKASASCMTELVSGRTIVEALSLVERFQCVLTGNQDQSDNLPEEVMAFSGVSKFPMRVKCATLAWHALKDALANRSELGDSQHDENPKDS